MEKSALAADSSSRLLRQIVPIADMVREMKPDEKPVQSLFLYSLMHHGTILFKTIWTNEDHKLLVNFMRKPSLFLHIESQLTTSEWIQCIEIILKCPIARQLIQNCNREFLEYNEDGFFLELLWALRVKKVGTKSRQELITTCLNLNVDVAALDLNYCIELFGCNAELDAFISGTGKVFINECTCEFPIPAFMFGWVREVNTQTLFMLFKNLIQYETFVTPRSKRHYIMLSLRFFSMPVQMKQQLEDLCKINIQKYKKVVDPLNLVPTFPSLKEICRNTLYKHMRPNIKIIRDFHDKLKKLGLPQTIINMITFKEPIYQ